MTGNRLELRLSVPRPLFGFSSAPFSRDVGSRRQHRRRRGCLAIHFSQDAQGVVFFLANQRGEAALPQANRLRGGGPRRLNWAGDWGGLALWLEVSDSVAAYPRPWCDVQVSCAGLAMPTRAEDYEVLYTIGTGSYGRCQKIRRKSDGKVSAGLVPVSAPAAVVQTAGGGPSAAEGKRGAWGCASGRQGAQKS